MSTELDPTDPTTPTDPGDPADPQTPDPTGGTEPPADAPVPPDDTEPVESSPEVPPPPDTPTSPVTFAPALWYSVDTVCLTTDMGNGNPCPNLNIVTTDPLVYSNAGHPIIVCGICGKQRTILAATLLDPQPEMS